MNSSGKVLIVFSVVIAILLISLTAVSLFFFQKEIDKRKITEVQLEDKSEMIFELSSELEQIKKSSFLFEEKNKEADEKINALLDELDLQKGVSSEIKKENRTLKDQIEKLAQEKEALRDELKKVASTNGTTDDLKKKLAAVMGEKQVLERKLTSSKEFNETLKKNILGLEEKITQQKMAGAVAAPVATRGEQVEKPVDVANEENVDLEKIVVIPDEVPEGRVLSVDKETEFVIVNLGIKDGVQMGNVLSVYRGTDYLGDIKVTRIQPEMSAADLIPPFSSRVVRKNDQVVSRK